MRKKNQKCGFFAIFHEKWSFKQEFCPLDACIEPNYFLCWFLYVCRPKVIQNEWAKGLLAELEIKKIEKNDIFCQFWSILAILGQKFFEIFVRLSIFFLFLVPPEYWLPLAKFGGYTTIYKQVTAIFVQKTQNLQKNFRIWSQFFKLLLGVQVWNFGWSNCGCGGSCGSNLAFFFKHLD